MARPRSEVLEQREQAFGRAFLTTRSFHAAATAARIDPGHVLRLLDRPDFAPVAAAVLAERDRQAA